MHLLRSMSNFISYNLFQNLDIFTKNRKTNFCNILLQAWLEEYGRDQYP